MKPNILSVISKQECQSLSEATFRILDEFGVLVTHAESVELLLSAGARKNDDGRICMNDALVRKLLSTAPRKFCMYHRHGGSLEIGSGRNWCSSGGTVSFILDYPDWTRRKAVRNDVVRFARLCDALPELHVVGLLVEAQDITQDKAEVITFAETLANTSKFIIVCPVKHSAAKAWVQMSKIACGVTDLSKTPSTGLLVSILPQLYLDDDCAATIILSAREGLPLVMTTGVVAGASCPNTIASGVVMKLAGSVFSACLSQIVRAGVGVMVNTGVTILEMSTSDIAEAGPEYPLGVAAQTQVLRELNLPAYSCSMHCDSKIGDFQGGIEKSIGMMTSMLSGVDLTTNLGLVSHCNAASYEQLVLDHELYLFLDRFSRGVSVNDDTLALEVIRDVGLGGDFLTHSHTAKHCRSGEMWYSRLFDRTSAGAAVTNLYEKAHDQVEMILREHTVAVDKNVTKELKTFVDNWSAC